MEQVIIMQLFIINLFSYFMCNVIVVALIQLGDGTTDW